MTLFSVGTRELASGVSTKTNSGSSRVTGGVEGGVPNSISSACLVASGLAEEKSMSIIDSRVSLSFASGPTNIILQMSPAETPRYGSIVDQLLGV